MLDVLIITYEREEVKRRLTGDETTELPRRR
jgi:hypothetical protein